MVMSADPYARIGRAMRAMRRPAAQSGDALYRQYAADQDVYNRTWKPTPYEPRQAEVEQVAEDLGVDLDTARQIIRDVSSGGGDDQSGWQEEGFAISRTLSNALSQSPLLANIFETFTKINNPESWSKPQPAAVTPPQAPQLERETISPVEAPSARAAREADITESRSMFGRRGEEQMEMEALANEMAAQLAQDREQMTEEAAQAARDAITQEGRLDGFSRAGAAARESMQEMDNQNRLDQMFTGPESLLDPAAPVEASRVGQFSPGFQLGSVDPAGRGMGIAGVVPSLADFLSNIDVPNVDLSFAPDVEASTLPGLVSGPTDVTRVRSYAAPQLTGMTVTPPSLIGAPMEVSRRAGQFASPGLGAARARAVAQDAEDFDVPGPNMGLANLAAAAQAAQEANEFGVPGPNMNPAVSRDVAELEQALPYGLGPPSNEMETTDQAYIGRFAIFEEAPTRAERQALARAGKVVVNLDANAAKDKNGRYITTQLAPMAVIPDNAPPSVRKAAEEYVAEIERLYTEQFGKSRPGIVVTQSQNKRGRTNTVHTEPFNVNEDRAAAFFASPEGQRRHAEILSRTFGKAPEVVFSIPHDPTGRDKGKDPGAVGKHGSEVDIARGVLDNLRRETAQFPSTTMTARGRQRNREQPQAEQPQPQRQQRSSLEALQQVLADLNPLGVGLAQAAPASDMGYSPQGVMTDVEAQQFQPIAAPAFIPPPAVAQPAPMSLASLDTGMSGVTADGMTSTIPEAGGVVGAEGPDAVEGLGIGPGMQGVAGQPSAAPTPSPSSSFADLSPSQAPVSDVTRGNLNDVQDVQEADVPSTAPTMSAMSPSSNPNALSPMEVNVITMTQEEMDAMFGPMPQEREPTRVSVATASIPGLDVDYSRNVALAPSIAPAPALMETAIEQAQAEDDPEAMESAISTAFADPVSFAASFSGFDDDSMTAPGLGVGFAEPGFTAGTPSISASAPFGGASLGQGLEASLASLASSYASPVSMSSAYGMQSEDTTEADPDGGMPGGRSPADTAMEAAAAALGSLGNEQDGPGTNDATSTGTDGGGGDSGGDMSGGGGADDYGGGYTGGDNFGGDGGWGGSGSDSSSSFSGSDGSFGGHSSTDSYGGGDPGSDGLGGNSGPSDGASTSSGPFADGGRVKAPTQYQAIIERALRAARRSRAA